MSAGRLMRAAQWYARRLNWRIFPCRPGEKLPAVKDWPTRAATDLDAIEAWWRDRPDFNIGVACGAGSNLAVLDVDGADGEVALVQLEAHHEPLPNFFCMQRTGGGGWQAFFAWPSGRIIRNSVGRLGPKLDSRGEGGYVVLPPSLHPSGNRYRWAEDQNPLRCPPGPMPAWLVDLLDPPKVEPRPAPEISGDGEQYALAALRAEVAEVAGSPEGQRNHRLNRAAWALGRFVASGNLPLVNVIHALVEAGRAAGLGEIEVRRTVESGLNARIGDMP